MSRKFAITLSFLIVAIMLAGVAGPAMAETEYDITVNNTVGFAGPARRCPIPKPETTGSSGKART